MAIDTTTPASRRVLLAGTVSGIAALAAHALGRPVATSASTAVLLGENNSSTNLTTITTTGNSSAFRGFASEAGTGVYGNSSSGTGLSGLSDSYIGVYGQSKSGTRPGVLGKSIGGNTGLQGHSGSGSQPPSPAKTGVFGSADQDHRSVGVRGHSLSGTGVYGSSGSGAPGSIGLKVGVYGWGPATTGLAPSYGVIGKSDSALGSGVLGRSDAGTGVSAASKTGHAFRAQGRVVFSTAGLTSITVGDENTTITPGVNLVATSIILCTLESNQGGLAIQRVTKDTTANTFKVFLSAAVAAGKSAKVAWFVIG
jgi:hypothetical protein